MCASAFMIIVFSICHVLFFSGFSRKKFRYLRKISKQYYNMQLRNYYRIYNILPFFLIVLGIFELIEIIGNSVLNLESSFFNSAQFFHNCTLQSNTALALLHRTKFMILPLVMPNIIYPVLLTFVYSILRYCTRMFSQTTRSYSCCFRIQLILTCTFQLGTLFILAYNPWSLTAIPFVFALFVCVDMIIVIYYTFRLNSVLRQVCTDTLCYTSDSRDIDDMIRFQRRYRNLMSVVVIFLLLLSLSLVLTALFDGFRNIFLNHCFYNLDIPDTPSRMDSRLSSILICTFVIIRFSSMILFDIFALATSVVICFKIVRFYRNICATSKLQASAKLIPDPVNC